MLEAYRIVSLQGDDGFLTISPTPLPFVRDSLTFFSPPPPHYSKQKKKKGDLPETWGDNKKKI